MKSHTTSAVSDSAETHIVRAVNTGIIDVSLQVFHKPRTETFGQVALVVQESEVKLRLLEQEEADVRTRHREVDD